LAASAATAAEETANFMVAVKGEEGDRMKREWWIEKESTTYFPRSMYTLCSETPYQIIGPALMFGKGEDGLRLGCV
jgi:hypothetical protein